ncbi:MAG: hypothetical protein LBR28_05715 [Bacteroidales bacterium]|jgi:rubrerythrin|nr:hypothetical protein [Bacteroidales bacterium]
MKRIQLTVAMIAIMSFSAIVGGSILTSCKSKQSIQKGSTEVAVPFAEKQYRTDKEFFRASQVGKSSDLATAKKIALANAKAELGGNIQSVIKAVTENYTNQRSVGDRQEYENQFEENARAVVIQTLNDVKIIGERAFKEKDGSITYYIAIEMSKDAVINAVSGKISNDAKLQLEFDKYRFKKVFDEEMEKFENQ